MWYSDGKLDYSKPIMAKSKHGNKYLLVAQQSDNYNFEGFDWLDVNTGRYNSCALFKTVEKAISCYSDYEIYNVDLTKL